MRAACEKEDRDPATMTFSFALTVCCGSDDAEVARRAAAIGQDPAQLREHQLGGTPSEVVEKIRAFGAVGATRAYLQVLDIDDLDQVALISREVMPNV